VLILVLEDHVVDIPVPQQGIGRIEVIGPQPGKHPASDLVHDPPAFGQARQAKAAPLAAGVLKWIEEPRHLDELDGSLQVLGKP